MAERSGLIVPLGSWVLREACEQLARWQAELGDAAIGAINVNVAVRQLREAGSSTRWPAVLGDDRAVPGTLVLEVTESSVLDGRQVRETLEALHEMGVRLALDDFGTGQSSLSLLRAFPVDVLKLDKSFVDGICDGEDKGRLAVAAAVAQLAENLQLKAVAEGIESEPPRRSACGSMGYRLGSGLTTWPGRCLRPRWRKIDADDGTGGDAGPARIRRHRLTTAAGRRRSSGDGGRLWACVRLNFLAVLGGPQDVERAVLVDRR